MGFFKLKKRCKLCAHVLRDDGTCQNEKCVKYVVENDSTDTGASGSPSTSSTKEA